MASIEDRLNAIEARNRRVELDKAWETSIERKVIITALTYATIVAFFLITGLPRPFTNSLIPTAGFVISTLSIPVFKRMWVKKKDKRAG